MVVINTLRLSKRGLSLSDSSLQSFATELISTSSARWYATAAAHFLIFHAQLPTSRFPIEVGWSGGRWSRSTTDHFRFVVWPYAARRRLSWPSCYCVIEHHGDRVLETVLMMSYGYEGDVAAGVDCWGIDFIFGAFSSFLEFLLAAFDFYFGDHQLWSQ